MLADLVIARIVEPTSLLDAARVLSDLGQPPASYATVKRTLKRVAVPGESSGALTYCEQVARRCFEHARSHGDVSLALYDVTTLYFEAEKEDDLRKGRPTQGTTYARSGSPRSVGPIRRSWWVCSSTGAGSPGDRLLRGQQGRDGHGHPRPQGIPGPPPARGHGRGRRRRMLSATNLRELDQARCGSSSARG